MTPGHGRHSVALIAKWSQFILSPDWFFARNFLLFVLMVVVKSFIDATKFSLECVNLPVFMSVCLIMKLFH
jgi:hypothetical protein